MGRSLCVIHAKLLNQRSLTVVADVLVSRAKRREIMQFVHTIQQLDRARVGEFIPSRHRVGIVPLAEG
jgi:hypothetical protein